jgi:hypothetical protein
MKVYLAWLFLWALPISLVLAGNCAAILAASPRYRASLSHQDSSDQLESLIKAWHSRQSRIVSFEFVWSQELTEFHKDGDKVTANKVKGPGGFTVDKRGWARLDATGEKYKMINVLKGKQQQTFSETNGGKKSDYPLLTITQAKATPTIFLNSRVKALLSIYRPFAEGTLPFQQSKLILVEMNAVLDDKRLMLVQDDNWLVWVDQSRDYLPVRCCLMEAKTNVIRKIDISYKEHEIHGWVPVSWKDDNTGNYSSKIDITSFSFNRQVPDTFFDLTLPNGTLVQDFITEHWFIQRSPNDKRPTDLEEISTFGYEKVSTSEPGQLRENISRADNRWYFIALAMAVVVCGWIVAKKKGWFGFNKNPNA